MPDSGVDPAARDKYLLQVTAGPSYNPSSHQQVSVNGTEATRIDSPQLTAWIRVRIKDYHGLPRDSPSSSPYFTHKQHTSDRYSIAYSFIPKQNMSGSDLVMGFDYDHSIKHQLPPGFKYAMKIATNMLDPGLYSDPYCDEPYLYGPALSSWFAFRIGDETSDVPAEQQLARLEQESENVIQEGADGTGASSRTEFGMPSKWKKRRKYFLDPGTQANFTFEKDRMYHADFFNPHLDFANFSLRLPGFSISVAKYVDEKTHHLRYVLRDRTRGEELFVVVFRLLFGRELEDTLEEERGSAPVADGGQKVDGETQEEVKKTRTVDIAQHPPSQNSERSTQCEPQAQVSPDEVSRDETNEDQSIIDQATTAANNLASSVTAVYTALGFGNSPSHSSDSEEDGSRSTSPSPENQALAAEIDDMDDETVERYLRMRHSSVEH